MNFDVIAMPPALTKLLDPSSFEEVKIGMSGAPVFRARSASTHSVFFLKVASTGPADDLHAEFRRLLWLHGRAPVPEAVYFDEFEDHDYLLLTAIPGVGSFDETLRQRVSQVIHTYAEGLRMVHALPRAECRFDARLPLRLDNAFRRVQSGQVSEEPFETSHQGVSPQVLYARLLEHHPPDEDLVVCHGDYCMPNVLLEPDSLALAGFIDWGRAGISDRYQDLALAARSIEFNLGPAWVAPFFDAYGVQVVDEEKVAFYRLLDEFF